MTALCSPRFVPPSLLVDGRRYSIQRFHGGKWCAETLADSTAQADAILARKRLQGPAKLRAIQIR